MNARWSLLLLATVAAVPGLACGSGTYPPVDSLAGEMTPEWEAFAERVDRACATNFNAGQENLAVLDAVVEDRDWSERQAESSYRMIQAKHQQATHDEVAALGRPPARPVLFGRWLANVGRRAELMRAIGRAWAAGDRRRTQVGSLRVLAQKIDADWLGQHFGLRICTSNGPSATRDSGEDYLEQVNEVCLRRTRQDRALWKRGAFSPNAAAGTSTGETLSMAAVAPPIEQYELRRRILEIKRAMDRAQIGAIDTAARDPDPDAWATASRGLNGRIVRERERLAALGLPACEWPEPPQ